MSNRNKDGYVELITDGACLGNPGPGGWAALLRYGDNEKLISGSEQETTNNRMELTAAIQGLKALKRPCQVKMRVDSQYVMKAFTEGWLKGWIKKGWINSQKEPVKNKDLWIELVEETERHQIEWEWVKGHAGDGDNERVDQAASAAAKSISGKTY